MLAGIDLTVRSGQIVALLARSGSGKSTLLRCLAGLIPSTTGNVLYKGTPLSGSNPGTAMVFQSFALLPWLTVQQNVELGLEARGMPANTQLPPASVDRLAGLAEILAQHHEPVDLGDLADELGLEVKNLLPLVDALDLLSYATANAHGVALTDTGVEFAAADVQTSKQLFAATMPHIPLVRTILTSLQRTDDGTLRADFFRGLLAHDYTAEQITAQLDVATDWGRYGELYAYDAISEEYQLDPAQRTLPMAG